MYKFSYVLKLNDIEYRISEKALKSNIECKKSKVFDMVVVNKILSRLHANVIKITGNGLDVKEGIHNIGVCLFEVNHD
jgi:hypothetical protein